MIDKIPSYPKIFALGNRCVQDIFDDDVEITEKLDGSHFAFGKINGQVHMRSKNLPLYMENMDYDKMFSSAMHHVKKIEDILPEGVVFYCEYLSRPKHNVLAYERTPKNHLALFATYNIGNQIFTGNYENLESEAKIFDIDIVPLIPHVNESLADVMNTALKRTSMLGGQLIEGIVIKNYKKDMMVGGTYIPIMTAKYVSDKFKEVHQGTWKKENSGKGKWETYIERFKTPARWNKGIQRLIESGDILYDPKDIGKLIHSIQKDIVEEEQDNIKDFLWQTYHQGLLRSAIGGFPEYYKQWLIERDISK